MTDKQKTIYDLELHEVLRVDIINIRRVPGGWVYHGDSIPPVFVPYSDEFRDKLARSESAVHPDEVPDNDGWIKWSGGYCPVRLEVLVDIRCQDGEERKGYAACQLPWTRRQGWDSITAYRVSKEQHRGSWTHCLAE